MIIHNPAARATRKNPEASGLTSGFEFIGRAVLLRRLNG